MEIEHLLIENITWFRRKAQLFCPNGEDAEDLASETIEKILMSRDRFDSNKDFRPWALTILRNTFISITGESVCHSLEWTTNMPIPHR